MSWQQSAPAHTDAVTRRLLHVATIEVHHPPAVPAVVGAVAQGVHLRHPGLAVPHTENLGGDAASAGTPQPAPAAVGLADTESPGRAAADPRPGRPLPAGQEMVISAAEHQSSRPSWDCRACEQPWPCDPARERLVQLYGRTTLSIFMVDRLLQATHDLIEAPPAELFDRFLAWTRRPTTADPPPSTY
jgi:hypothetical protein